MDDRGFYSIIDYTVDGTRLYNLVHWASEADFREFEETSDTAGRMAAIQSALDGTVRSRCAADDRSPSLRRSARGRARVRAPDPRWAITRIDLNLRSLCGWLRRGHNSLP